MHTADDVDHLRDVEVGRGAEVGVGEVLVEAPARPDERDRRADAPAHGLAKVGVEARGHQIFVCADEGPGELAERGGLGRLTFRGPIGGERQVA